MSYARFGWDGSDVYVFLDVGGFLSCCGCGLSRKSFKANSTDEMIAHLREHIAAGDCVPADVIPGLEAVRAENDSFIKQGGEPDY